MKRLDRDSFHWPATPDELQKVTLKEIHWLCDGLSLNPSGAFEDHTSSYKRKKRSGKKEEDLSVFETTEVIEYRLTGMDRYCPYCNTKYKVVAKETVKRLKFVPARFEVVEENTYVYSCPKCGWIFRLPCPCCPVIGNRKSVFKETAIPKMETINIYPLECKHAP